MTAFEKVQSLYAQLASGARISPTVFEKHLKELYAEHEQLLAAFATSAAKVEGQKSKASILKPSSFVHRPSTQL
jgi:hypothetical protein